jgi:hypothetical protein
MTESDCSERECLMGHEWCDGPDGETESDVPWGGLCSECSIRRSREELSDTETK